MTEGNQRTIRPTGKPNQFVVTDHFDFMGQPATQEKIVYDDQHSDAYHDEVSRTLKYLNEEDYDAVYDCPREVVIEGQTYYYPGVKHLDDVHQEIQMSDLINKRVQMIISASKDKKWSEVKESACMIVKIIDQNT